MTKGILGKKLGMTQIFEADGKMIPVTVVEAGPCIVIQNKTEENKGGQHHHGPIRSIKASAYLYTT